MGSEGIRREGGCSCGAVRYAVTGEPVSVTVCHCADCQRQSGSAFGMSMLVRESAFELVAGELRTYEMSADSGAGKRCVFCPACGTRIYNALESLPGILNVKPGTLDDTGWLIPSVHVWVGRKQRWFEPPAGVRCFQWNPKLG